MQAKQTSETNLLVKVRFMSDPNRSNQITEKIPSTVVTFLQKTELENESDGSVLLSSQGKWDHKRQILKTHLCTFELKYIGHTVFQFAKSGR